MAMFSFLGGGGGGGGWLVFPLRGNIGVRAGRAMGAGAPPNFGQLRFFGRHEKIWAKPVFKDVCMFLLFF